MLCRKNSAIFPSNAPITLVNLCTGYKWGSGITPKTPSGGQASLGPTQQAQRLTLSRVLRLPVTAFVESPIHN